MSRPRLFSFFNRLPGASAIVPAPFAAVETPAAALVPDAVVAGLTAKLAEVTAERDQNAAALTAAAQAQAESVTAIAAAEATNVAQSVQLSALTTERDTFKLAAEKTRADIVQEVRNAELATLAASQGVPASAELVPANSTPEPTRGEKIADLTAKLAACTSPTERFELSKQARALSAA